MSQNPLYKIETQSPRLLLRKAEAAEALGVSTRVLEALEKRGDIISVQIAPCFPKENPDAKSRRGPQAMKRYPLASLREYVARLASDETEPISDDDGPTT